MKIKGVSLIVLVITIVVIIILAAAVVLAISNNNPVGNSKVASVTQVRDSLQSGILVYTGNVAAKTLGDYTSSQILLGSTENTSTYKIIEEGNIATVQNAGSDVTVYKLDYTKVKDNLNLEIKDNGTGSWYIDEYGIVYLVYSSSNSVPTYYKENNTIISSLSGFVTIAGAANITYNSNGGSLVENQIKEGDSITLRAAPTKDNASFEYWQDANGNTYEAESTYTGASSLNLTAVWSYTASNISAMNDTEKQSIIGKSVSLESANGWTDWKVFSSDGTNIMLITGDYIPVSILPSGHGFSSGSYNTAYCVNSATSRADLLSKLTTASTFAGFKDSAGKVTIARIPTIDDFTKSYNAVTHDGRTYTDAEHPDGYPVVQKIYYKDNGVNGGYNVSSDVNGATSNDNVPNNAYSNYGLPRTETNYGNLWVIEDNTNLYGYWISTISSLGTENLLNVNCLGAMSSNNYLITSRGLRTVVVLDSSVKLVQHVNESNITYTIE